MSLARFRASIRWSSDLSGAAAEVLTEAGIAAASIAAASARARGARPIFRQIHLDLELRSRPEVRRCRRFSVFAAVSGAAGAAGPSADLRRRREAALCERLGELGADPRARPRGRGSSRCRPRPGSRRRRAARARRRPLAIPPSRSPGSHDRGRDGGAPAASATGRTAGPESPPRPAPSQGRSVAGSMAARLQRVDQRDGVGAALLGGDRDRGRVGDVRRQLDDQRLGGQRAQRLAAAPRSRPAPRRRSGPSGRWGRRR